MIRAAEIDNEARELARELLGGNRRALARAVTELERLSPLAPPLLSELRGRLGGARVIGITGPPGAGKSTLVNAMISSLRRAGERVGVIAVDPSSPVSGGAILGDRVRMAAALDDEGVYVRSLAAQGHLGGLSPAAVRIIDALDAAGFATIILETVGTGQSEIDIAEVADVRIVVSAPGLGDGIQAMKAGLLEIADIMVVNKADRDGAEHTVQQLTAALALQPGRAPVPVLKTVATSDTGIEQLIAAIDAVGGPMALLSGIERRRRRARYLISRAAVELVERRLAEIGPAGLDPLADGVLDGRLSPLDAGQQIIRGSIGAGT